MTKDEIHEFVEKTIRDGWDRDEMVKQIVEKWEEDVQANRDEARQSGIHDGQESAWIYDGGPSIG